jgi:hypothetical protein
MEVSDQFHAMGKESGCHWIGGYMDPGASLDVMEERKKPLFLLGIEPRLLSP